MATAFKEKTKNEQFGNHTVSPAAQYDSMCTR